MSVLNMGSLNVDYLYRVPHFVNPGETLAATGMSVFSGGKGLNQSIALAKAGLEVCHAGYVGADGNVLVNTLRSVNVSTDYIRRLDNIPSGHTIIQVDDDGENCIIVFGGANQTLSRKFISETISNFGDNGFLLLQNEVNDVGFMIECGKENGLQVVFNPSPYNESVVKLPLELVDYLILNKTEAKFITGTDQTEDIIPAIAIKYPAANILLTLGENGSLYFDGERVFSRACEHAEAVVDTTGAGDTFLGYFLYGIACGMLAPDILKLASVASAIAVSRYGAAPSIPSMEEVKERLSERI